jgi:methylthioribose-1-phosphate isomerase
VPFVADVVDAIRELAIRGAPAIGIAAAYAFALAAEHGEDLDEAAALLAASRPTAVNLAWALEQMRDDPTPARARALHDEEVERCHTMAARNPASDVTPGGLITAIVTEHGVHLAPYEQSLAALV